MGALRIRLFGTVHVSHDDRRQDPRPIHAVQGLLAYLLINRHRHHPREVLAGLFWGEQAEARARSCLSTALWRLRRLLEPPGIARGTYLATFGSDEVAFNTDSDHWLDVAEFEAGVRLRPETDWTGVETAASHYVGDLLEGFYDEWALRERERLRIIYLDSLARLLRHHAESDAVEGALACGRRILELDPLREDVHRELIRLHLRNGHRATALRQYQTCRALLREELGVEPTEETQVLYDTIISEGARRHGARPALRDLLPPLRAAATSLSGVRDQLELAIRLAETDEASPSR